MLTQLPDAAPPSDLVQRAQEEMDRARRRLDDGDDGGAVRALHSANERLLEAVDALVADALLVDDAERAWLAFLAARHGEPGLAARLLAPEAAA